MSETHGAQPSTEAVDKFFESGGSDVPAGISEAPAAPPEPAAPPAEPQGGMPRDEQGRFTSPQKPAEAAPAPPASEPAQQPQAPQAPAAAAATVPLAVLLEERRKFDAKMAELEARLPRAEAPKGPSLQDDPIAYFESQIAEIKRAANETAEQFQARQQFEALANHVTTSEQRFAEGNKDYFAAAQHLDKALAGFFVAQGLPEQQAKMEAGRAKVTFAANAIRAGKDPATEAYALAKLYGYAPAPAAPAAPAAPPQEPAAKLAAIQAGQAAAKSLGATGGSAPSGDPLHALLTAADDPASAEFDRLWEQNFGRSKDRPLFR